MTTSERLAEALAGRYAIEQEIGAGGMATVLRARDLRHPRVVAIKVLRPELAAAIGTERFLTEIGTTAALQHPNVLPLFDSGAVDGSPPILYYVMPYVQGSTLRARLERERQLPLADVRRIVADVAGALDAAHRRGIVHRDVKPENILLQDGHALVADFGIALAARAGDPRLTELGTSIGTPGYMPPEQATGDRALDLRADVFALGAVTYEMLTGAAPRHFDPPAPSHVRRTVPPALDAAVLSALSVLPADRPSSAGDFAHAVETALAEPVPARGRRARVPRAAMVVGAAALLAVGGLAASVVRPAGAAPPSRLAIVAPIVGGSGGPALRRQLALLPDGSGVVYVSAAADGSNQLHLRRLDAEEAEPIPGSEHVASPVVSPDGRWIAAGGVHRSHRIPAGGGTPEAFGDPWLTDAAAWDEHGRLWVSRIGQPLAYVGSADSLVPAFDDVERAALTASLRIQQVLPGGRFALTVHRTTQSASGAVFLLDLKRGDTSAVPLERVVEIRYTSGYLVYARADGSLHAAAFDPRRRRVTGEPVRIASNVSLTGSGLAQIAVAENGTVAYVPEEPRSLVLIGRDGAMRAATPARHNFHAPRFSPDGSRLSVDFISGDGRDVWVLQFADGTLARATFDGDGHDATWTPDGGALTYTTERTGAFGIRRTRPGSTAPAESLLAHPRLAWTGEWLPDGSGLVTVVTNYAPGAVNDIALVRGGGRGPVVPLVSTPADERHPAVSPDGRWVALVSNRSGREEVYVRAIGGDDRLVQVSHDGGTEPVWARSGRELFYRHTGESGVRLIAAAVRTDSGFAVTGRTALFDAGDIVPSTPHAGYDVSPDGETFAMVRRSPAGRIVVLQNLPGLVGRGSAARRLKVARRLGAARRLGGGIPPRPRA